MLPGSARPARKPFAALVRTDPLSTIVTVSIDVLSAAAAVSIGVWWASRTQGNTASVAMIAIFVPVVIVILGLRSVYRRKLNRNFLDEIGPVEAAVTLASMSVLTVMVLAGFPGRPGETVSRLWICAAVLMPTARLIRVIVERSLRRHRELVSPTLIVGNGRVAHHVIERLTAAPECGLEPIGLLDAESPWDSAGGKSDFGIPRIGSLDSVEEAILNTGAEAMVIAFSRTQDELLTPVVRVAHRYGLRVWVVPRLFDIVGERARVDHIGGLPLLALTHTDPRGWQFTAKYSMDRVVAALGLLVTSPLFLTLLVLVRLSSPGPVFFRQERVGRDGRVFDCLKFRTMRSPRASDAGFDLGAGTAPGGVEGVDRRTRIGKILRSTSMDELPQLINVVKGDMSLVGPRPERPEFVHLFEMQIRRYGERHRVKAGLTGWAQVNGLRGQTSIADRAEWDNYYIENWSLALDLKILALTVLAVLRRAE